MKALLAVLMFAAVAGAQSVPPEVKAVLKAHAPLIKKIQSCEKRGWPVGDPVCHGAALSMAHSRVLEHPEFYGPNALKDEKNPKTEQTDTLGLGLGILTCPENQTLGLRQSEDGKPEMACMERWEPCDPYWTLNDQGRCQMVATISPRWRNFSCTMKDAKKGEERLLICTWTPKKEFAQSGREGK